MTKIVASNDDGAAVEIEALVKSFGSTRALDGLSLTVGRAMVYGLLGPNGAGKTTAVRILATLVRQDSGTARVCGHDVTRDAAAVRSKIALTGQFASVDEDLTGRENLIVLSRLHGYRHRQATARADELLERFALDEAGHRLVKTYSGGMRRRLDIAASVIVRPPLLFLDEPTTGLDPRAREQVWGIVRDLTSEGTTVLLTTQYLDEAERLTDRLGVMDDGRLIAEGTPAELKASLGRRSLRIRMLDLHEAIQGRLALSAAFGMDVAIAEADAELSIQLAATQSARSEAQQVALALAELGRAGIAVSEIGIEQPSLDEVFLALTTDPDAVSNASEVGGASAEVIDA